MCTNGIEESRLRALAKPEELQREVTRALAGVAPTNASVAFSCSTDAASAWATDGKRRSSAATREPMRIGCIAKLLTATLAKSAFTSALFAPDDDVADLLGARATTRMLRGITVRHLLEHTHGLDDALLSEVPRRADRCIDVDALVLRLHAAGVLAPPGAIYSYGNAGAWLTAALLEQRTARPYTAQVCQELLAPIGIGASARADAPDARICPSTGGALALDSTDLLRLIAQVALRDPAAWPDESGAGPLGPVTTLPGWNPLERGVYLGWKYHGRGWFGHQSVWPDSSVLVRAHPRRALALVVMSREHAAAVVAARVFGAHFPELFDTRVPVGEGVAFAPESHIGTYTSAAWHVAIRAARGGLELCARSRRERKCDDRWASLWRVAGGVFFTRPTVAEFPHIELAALDPATVFLWNGRFVLRKVGFQPA